MIEVGDRVAHFKFGEGLVTRVFEGYAEVDFFHYGKKFLLFDVLKKLETTGEVSNPIKLTQRELVETALTILSEKHKDWMYLRDIYLSILHITAVDIPMQNLETELDAVQGMVFRNRLLRLEQSLPETGGVVLATNIKIDENKNRIIKPDAEFANFKLLCSKLRLKNSTQAFFVRSILRFAKNSTRIHLTFRTIANDIFNEYLYQISIGPLNNIDGQPNNPAYYDNIKQMYNKIRPELSKNEAIQKIEAVVKFHIANQFLLYKEEKTNVYEVKPEYLSFHPDIIKKIGEESDQIDKQIINKLNYFLSNANLEKRSATISAYISDLRRGLDSIEKRNVAKFAYEANVLDMKRTLKADFYTKDDFKYIMQKHGIPYTKENFKKCLDRLDYRLKTKQIILHNKYGSLKSFFKQTMPETEIYRYSNPQNLEEYDTILKALNEELFLVEVDSGVYLTIYNLERNGIDSKVINKFHNKVKKFGLDKTFFSADQIRDAFPTDEVVQFCGSDNKELIQFITPIYEIKTIKLDNGDLVFYMGKEKTKGALLKYVMSNKEKMTVYDIEDFIEDNIGVKYLETDIEYDIRFTTFYYSQEMGTVYRNKKLFLKEVYRDD